MSGEEELAHRLKGKPWPEVVYKGKQRDQNKGREISVKVGKSRVDVEWSPEHKNILVHDEKHEETMIIPLDEDEGYPLSERIEKPQKW